MTASFSAIAQCSPASHFSKDVDAMLDDGAAALKWFDLAVIRYDRYFGRTPAGKSYKDICVSYDRQRGMRLDKLVDVGNTLNQVSGSGGDTATAQQAGVHALADSLDATLDALVGMTIRAGADVSGLQAIGSACATAAQSLYDCVKGKVDAVTPLGSDLAVGGAKMDNGDRDDVSVIIDVAEHDFGIWNIDRVHELITDAPADGFGYGPASGEVAKKWLETVFEPYVDNMVKWFVQVCDETEKSVQAIYSELVGAFKTVDDSNYLSRFPSEAPKMDYARNIERIAEQHAGAMIRARNHLYDMQDALGTRARALSRHLQTQRDRERRQHIAAEYPGSAEADRLARLEADRRAARRRCESNETYVLPTDWTDADEYGEYMPSSWLE
jgi:hypothetical protein